MANKNDNYYFIHGNEVGSKTIYVPYKTSVVKNVKDISDFDIATIEMGDQIQEKLKECNPGVKFEHSNYIGKFPYTRGIKIFKTIEVLKVPQKAIKIVNGFRDFAEERNSYYYAGKKLGLQDTGAVVKLVEDILSDLSINNKREIFGKQSFLGNDIKNYYYDNKYNFDRTISNYTQLRNLLIAYLNIKSGKNVPKYYKMDAMSKSLDSIDGLYQEDPAVIKQALIDYKEELIKAKNEEQRRIAEEELKRKTSGSQYNQMTLFDIYPELVPDSSKEPGPRKGRVKDLLDE